MQGESAGNPRVVVIVVLGLIIAGWMAAAAAINAKIMDTEKTLRLKLLITENRINISKLSGISAQGRKPAKLVLRTRQVSAFSNESEEYCKKDERLKAGWEAMKEQFVKYGILRQDRPDETEVAAKEPDAMIVLYNGFTGLISSVDNGEYEVTY